MERSFSFSFSFLGGKRGLTPLIFIWTERQAELRLKIVPELFHVLNKFNPELHTIFSKRFYPGLWVFNQEKRYDTRSWLFSERCLSLGRLRVGHAAFDKRCKISDTAEFRPWWSFKKFWWLLEISSNQVLEAWLTFL